MTASDRGKQRRPYARVARVLSLLGRHGIGGVWKTGTTAGPGRVGAEQRYVNCIWGPDGFVLGVIGPDGRAFMRLLRQANVRRPCIIQVVHDADSRREVVRMELSDFLDLLESHMKVLAQEGRLGDNE